MNKSVSLERIVNNKVQELMAKDPALKVTMNCSIGPCFFEVTLAKENEYKEQTEKYIVHNSITGPNTTDLVIRKLWDWRSGGYWNQCSNEVIHDIKYC
jgi:hypothetical protein